MKNKGKNAIYVSVTELADMLGVSRTAVFKAIQNGKIQAEKIGQSYAIPMEDARLLLKERNTGTITESIEDKHHAISVAVDRVIAEYGETLRLLGKE